VQCGFFFIFLHVQCRCLFHLVYLISFDCVVYSSTCYNKLCHILEALWKYTKLLLYNYRVHHTCKKLDFSLELREHEGEVKAWQGDFQQLQRHVSTKMCCFFTSFKKKLHLKCAFANILLISFIFNFKFLFCTCIIIVDLSCQF
jgi:hypothetical protein